MPTRSAAGQGEPRQRGVSQRSTRHSASAAGVATPSLAAALSAGTLLPSRVRPALRRLPPQAAASVWSPKQVSRHARRVGNARRQCSGRCPGGGRSNTPRTDAGCGTFAVFHSVQGGVTVEPEGGADEQGRGVGDTRGRGDVEGATEGVHEALEARLPPGRRGVRLRHLASPLRSRGRWRIIAASRPPRRWASRLKAKGGAAELIQGGT